MADQHDQIKADTLKSELQRDMPARSGGGALLDDRTNREIIDRLQRDGRMSFSEIAQQLGVSEGTVAWRMSEVKKHLREMAEKEART